ncbi:uncharacterized protein LOC103175409 isoform X2 [Callorhinchus milii]|uniref:uncharacterized protein LOC103175409 isoform X2 n=1 Tax=Callorhinchus milii TaxID=7868 RepID=UPI0004576364|nr:uncharacterized protein LOC103175409 isoform X2 [Callorhinchus milii]|eukprot:gi/632942806/ref/XP_007886626.1/ PREDICTED: uncharacterized protein LOC103175409 isoform X2 [Callorhinchus milii]
MATDENTHNLFFESFLKKRKDKMRFTWSTYWFRLQNTTLFFFTRKESEACHLRGQYYIYMVQSVRETKTMNHDYPFEIVMKNGKKKVLAATTSELRAVWMEFLWKAMQLPWPGKKHSACNWHDIPLLMERAEMCCPGKEGGSSGYADGQSRQLGSLTSNDSSADSQKSSLQYLDTSVDGYSVERKNVASSTAEEEDRDYEIVLPDLEGSAPEAPLSPNTRSGLLDEIISNCTSCTVHWLGSVDTEARECGE